MVVGEAPGRFEDEQGRPFVGRAGQLLDELLRGGRARARRGLHHQRRQGPPAGQPRPHGGRGGALDAGARAAARAGRAAAGRAARPPRARALRARPPRSARSTGARSPSAAASCSRSTTRPPRCARRSCARRCSPTPARWESWRVCARPRPANRGPWRSWRSHRWSPSRGRRAPEPAPAAALVRRRRGPARARGRLRGDAARDHRGRRHRAAGAVRQAHDGRRAAGDHRAAAGDAARPARALAAQRKARRRRSPPRSRSLLAFVVFLGLWGLVIPPFVTQVPDVVENVQQGAGQVGDAARPLGLSDREVQDAIEKARDQLAGRPGRRQAAQRARCCSCSGRPP